MKKWIYSACAALALMACAKETPVTTEGEGLVRVSFTATLSPETKTALTGDNQVKWLKGDQIAILDGTAKTLLTASNISEDGLTATFEGDVPDAAEYYAVYPNTNNVTYDGTTLTAEINQYQPGTAGSFANANNVAVARTTKEAASLRFHNLGALVKVKVCASDVKQLQLKVRGDQTVAGRFAVEFDGETPVIGTYTKEWKEVYINQNIVPGDYYFVISPQVEKAGFQVSMSYYGGKASNYFTTNGTFTLAAGHLLDIGVVGAGYVVKGTTSSRLYLAHTLENSNVYAAKGFLKAGNYYISYQNDADALFPSSGHSINDAVATAYGTGDAAEASSRYWTIPSDGDYRFVLDREAGTVTIYSETNDLHPKVVEWTLAGKYPLSTTVASDIWLRGASAGWASAGVKRVWSPSPADPQILIMEGYSYSANNGQALNFAIWSGGIETYTSNNSYCFSPSADKTLLVLDTWAPMVGGNGSQRNQYFSIPAINTIILDLRNMRIKVLNRS